MVRINGDGFDPEGLGLGEAKVLARKLQDTGIDALDISAGTWKSRVRTVPPNSFPRGCHVYLAEAIKKEVRIPVIAVGRINDPVLADEIVQEGKADLIAMGRALLADPFLPEKARRGRLEDIRMCIGCNYCYEERLYRNKRIKCAINASLGRERECELKPSQKAKKIFVIGGGPAGLESARTLKMRGHNVVLLEKEANLGGQLRQALVPPHKEELKNILDWLSHAVRESGVEIHLGHRVTADFLSLVDADEIILAVGSLSGVLNIPGAKGERVFSARDILGRIEKFELGNEIVILGGGRVGCEAAEYLAQKKKKVTLIEKLDKVGSDISPEIRRLLLERLRALPVEIYCNCEVIGIEDNKVFFYDRERRKQEVIADSVLFAVGSQANDTLERQLNGKKDFYSIGDCSMPGNIVDAIHAGARIGRIL